MHYIAYVYIRMYYWNWHATEYWYFQNIRVSDLSPIYDSRILKQGAPISRSPTLLIFALDTEAFSERLVSFVTSHGQKSSPEPQKNMVHWDATCLGSCASTLGNLRSVTSHYLSSGV